MVQRIVLSETPVNAIPYQLLSINFFEKQVKKRCVQLLPDYGS